MLSLSFLFVTQLFIACQKSETPTPANNQELPDAVITTVKNFTAQYGAIQNVIKMIQDAMTKYAPNGRVSTETELLGDLPTCAKVTPDLNNKTFKIDFGSGCPMKNGAKISGSFSIIYTGKFGQTGSTITIIMTNLGVEGNTLDGKLEMKDFAKVGTQIEYRIVMSELKISQAGKISTINLDLKQTWQSGFTTTDDSDNQILTNFSGNFTEPSGAYYSVATPSSLLTKGDCEPLAYPVPVSGILDMTPKSGTKVSVDFGTGTCDTIVRISSGRVSQDVDLASK